MTSPRDPRAAVEFRVPAARLVKGDLVNTSPGEDDWQEVLAVVTSAADASTPELEELAAALDGRYVIVQLTDVSPVDSGIYFADGKALVYGADESGDQPVSDVVSGEDGVRTYLYTKYELVAVRATD